MNGKEMFSKCIRIKGGQPWRHKSEGVRGYSSQDGNFDVLQYDDYAVLVSFVHEPNEGDHEFWRKRFKTALQAIEYAEGM